MALNHQPPPDNATTQTLNHVLGNLGGRQKSWMTPHGDVTPTSLPIDPAQHSTTPLPFTLRRRGRPRREKPTQLPRPRAIAPSSRRQSESASNSASPQLANVAVCHDSASHGPSDATVFPSPVPSEENTSNAALTPTGLAPGDPCSFDTVQPTAAADTPCNDISCTDAPCRESIVGSPLVEQLYLRSLPQVQDSRPSRIPPQPQPPFEPARRASPHQSCPVLAPKPPPAPSNSCDWYTVDECRAALHPSRSPAPANHPLSEMRLRHLLEAVELADWSYLIMHQYYCMLTLCRDKVPDAVKTYPTLDMAIFAMDQVLDSNAKLPACFLEFFTQVPFPIHQLASRWPQMFNYYTLRFQEFVMHSGKFEMLVQLCETRACPVLARELSLNLKLDSVVMQRLLFTFSLRRIWHNEIDPKKETEFVNKAMYIFQTNQTLFYSQSSGQLPYSTEVALYEDYASALRRLAKDHSLTNQQMNVSPQLVLGQAQQVLPSGYYHPSLLSSQMQQQQSSMTPCGQAQQPPNFQFSHHQPANPQPYAQQTATSQSRMLRCANPHFTQPEQPPNPHVQYNQPQPQPPTNTHVQQRYNNPVSHGNLSQRLPRLNTSLDPQSAQAAIQYYRQLQPLVQHVQAPQVEPLLPRLGELQDLQREPNPARFSLHQAHLHSPVLSTKTFSSPLYIFPQEFIMPPARLSQPGRSIEKWTFTISREQFQALPHTSYIAGAPPTRDIDDSSKFVRLRCIKYYDRKEPTEHLWAASDTQWIPRSYFSLNSHPLEQRKKLHHGKDMPIDITHLVREGENTLEATVLTSTTTDSSHQHYLLAVELISIMSHALLKLRLLSHNVLPAHQVLDCIKHKLTDLPISDPSDDDVTLISEASLTITLFDPFFQSAFCNIPVRGRACLHNDCFDFDTFLSTRPRKGGASVIDQWRCPICRADARPHVLVVDRFVKDVCIKLSAMGLQNTRAIVVSKNGTWCPKKDKEGAGDRTRVPVPREKKRKSIVPEDAEIVDLCD
ncbi:Zinc finger MIZ-type [Pyrenophora seminiperda CCB06]|uniref:Zinc finger MIZ-type n=1 Tax=Pyrenophora seminiperda CCB06 TaxID=1302712 RepID=A0A3M7MHC8_9PLEO|nr:Zinc finger MIZ-type [Pyrenophora seminiperda CCB06]